MLAVNGCGPNERFSSTSLGTGEPLGQTGRFLHDFRDRKPNFASSEKGFFDMGDIAWMIDPTLCQMETVPAPMLRPHLEFDRRRHFGKMLRVMKIDVSRTWERFFQILSDAHRRKEIQ